MRNVLSNRRGPLTGPFIGSRRRVALVVGAGTVMAGWVAVGVLWPRVEHAAALDLGARLYREQSCVACHGERGRGDGPRAETLDPPPRDFRSPAAFVQGTTARDVAATLDTGVVVRPSQMPSFAHLSERERLALGEFIVSLRERQARDLPGTDPGVH